MFIVLVFPKDLFIVAPFSGAKILFIVPLPWGVQDFVYSGLAGLQRAAPHIGTIEAVTVCIACKKISWWTSLAPCLLISFLCGEGEGFDIHPRQLQLQKQV